VFRPSKAFIQRRAFAYEYFLPSNLIALSEPHWCLYEVVQNMFHAFDDKSMWLHWVQISRIGVKTDGDVSTHVTRSSLI
jgi:hypothetical protein